MFRSLIGMFRARKEAHSLLQRFRYASNPDAAIRVAEQMKQHFDDCWGRKPNDSVGHALLDTMLPKQGFRVPGVVDLTGGRPDTPEWVAFMLVADQDNSDYYEYLDGLESWADQGRDLRWIVPLIRRLSEGYEGYTLDKSRRTVNRILHGG